MYRENIYGIIENTGERITTLVVPKNSGLKGYAWKALQEAGLDIESSTKVDDSTLKVGQLTLLLRRGEDIPKIVQEQFRLGQIMLGITGDDLFDEYRLKEPGNTLKVENTYDWVDEKAKFLRPALCLIGKAKDPNISPESTIAINAKYELTSRNYLATAPALKGLKLVTEVFNGDLESTVSSGLANSCIDTVYTGKSIVDNRLRILEPIRFSDIVAISPLKREESLFGRVMSEEMRRFQDRMSRPIESYTSKLLLDPEMLRRKLMEEAYELAMASAGFGNPAAEAADVNYAVGLLLTQKGITLDDVAREILKRQT